MSKLEFTHVAKIYGIPCFFHEETMDIEGTNWLYDKLIDVAIFIDEALRITDGFYITDLKEIKKVD